MRHLDYLAARIVVAADPTPTPTQGGGGVRDSGGTVVEPEPPSWLNSTAVIGVLVFVAGVLFIWIGTGMIGRSKKGDVKQAANQSAVAVIGTIWIIIGVGGLAFTMIGGLIYAFYQQSG